MKNIFTITLFLSFLSCSTTVPDDQLNQRINSLEKRLDSLTGTDSVYSKGSYSFNTTWQTNRCKAITKRGKQCKRKPKYKGYCWQHSN